MIPHDMILNSVTQKKDKPFGDVALFLFGDIMQLKPCRGRYIFEGPICEDYLLNHNLRRLWETFDVITLEENHRQNEDKDYAEILNRIRIGKPTEDDLKTLLINVIWKSLFRHV